MSRWENYVGIIGWKLSTICALQMTSELQRPFDTKDGPSVGGMRVNKNLK